MKRYLLAWLTLISLVTTLNAAPTAEGLFRNVSNKETTGNLIVVTAQIEEFAAPIKENSLIQTTQSIPEQEVQPDGPVYVKWLISIERERIVDVIQVLYNDPQMKKVSSAGVRYFPEFKKMMKNDSSIERSLFYALFMMLTLNDSELVGSVMTKYAQGYIPNKELMSREKINLYYRYKEYLEKRQDDPSLVSPLEPEDEERAKQVQEILTTPMYRDANNVKLVRFDSELAWHVDVKNMQAYFSNEMHRLKRLDYQSPLGDIRILFDDYVLFNGTHELPKTVIIKDMSQKSWKLRFTGLSHLNSSKAFTERAKDYAEAAKGATEALLTPSIPFLF